MGNPAFRRGERGFTLIETMAAAFVLLVGVMATLALIDRANTTASVTAARDAGTNLARELIEAARSVPFDDLNDAAIGSKLQAIPGLASSSPSSYRIERRNVAYTVTASVCTMDDAKDGGGPRPSGVTFCPQSVAQNTANPTTGKVDKNPEDYKVVTVKADWTRNGVTRNVTQTGIVNNPGSALGPSVTSVSPDGFPAPYVVTTDPATGDLTIMIQTSSRPATVSWSIDGTSQQATPTASGATGLVWKVPWTIKPLDGSKPLDDGPYLIGAKAYNQYGVSGAGRSETIVLNRYKPRAPENVAGGRNAHGGIDIEWDANTERDIIGYQVTRGDGTVVCPLQTQKLSTTCTDPSPPDQPLVTYHVWAYDTAPDTGQPRPGYDSDPLGVTETDTPPFQPATLSAASSGGVTTLTWQRPSPSDPDSGDDIAFYRIYRDGTGVADRYDRWYDTGDTVTWQDTHTAGAQHTYWVSSVDEHFGESRLLGPVTG